MTPAQLSKVKALVHEWAGQFQEQLCAALKEEPKPADPGPAPFSTSDYVVYYKAADAPSRATKVDKVELRDGRWQWQSPVSAWRDCADYRVVAKSVPIDDGSTPDILPVGTKVKMLNLRTGEYRFNGDVLTVAGYGTFGNTPDLYWFEEGAGAVPRAWLEVVQP